jgi:hypothetical protein
MLLAALVWLGGAAAACAAEAAKPAAGAAQAAKPAAASTDAQAAKPAAAGAEAAVRARVEEYWKARSTMNLLAVQPFYEPEFRSKYTPEAFARDFRRLNRFAPEFMGVEGVTVDGKKATVKVKLRTKPDILQGQELISVVEEIWLNVDGGWFRQSESLLPNI